MVRAGSEDRSGRHGERGKEPGDRKSDSGQRERRGEINKSFIFGS
jgi:hypothetical protein